MAANEQTMTPPAMATTPPATATKWTAPTAKVTTGVVAASLTTLIFSLWVPLTGHKLEWPPESAGALTTLVTFVMQYLVPERN
jgi:hypothetical protein